MKPQTSTDYSVDNRQGGANLSLGTGGGKRCGTGNMDGKQCATDNSEGKHFLNKFIDQKKASEETHLTQQRKQDNRFLVSGPGDSEYSFKNAFAAQKSPIAKRAAMMTPTA